MNKKLQKGAGLIALLLLFSVFSANAQQWRSNLPQKQEGELTFFDYQKAFNDYWTPFNVGANGRYIDENGIEKRASGYKQFKRWEWYWAPRVDQKTGKFPEKSGFDIWEDYKVKNDIKSTSGTWISIGDHELDPLNEPSLQESGTGRINCAAFDPDDNNHFWVGAPAGGLWETTNGGTSWTCKTDANPILGVSDIALSPNYSSDNTIYIATGDRDAGDDPSIGLLKSTDNGATWQKTGLIFDASAGSQAVRVIVDPGNANIIYVATSVGFYKSTDAGDNFTLKQTGNFIDMDMIPNSEGGAGGADLIATTNTANAQAWRSTDAGETWAATLTAPNAEEDRMDIAVTIADPNYVYVITAWDGGAIGSIYRSTNAGASFTEVYDGASSNNLFAWDQVNTRADGGQGFYDVTLAVSALNRDIVYVGGVNAFISTNGASSFVMSNRWDPAAGGSADEVHADHHNAYFVKTSPTTETLFDCNDGGFYYTTNANSGSGANWIDITDGLITGQLYDIGVSQTENGSVVGGYQDNGGKYRDISTSATDWEQIREGDGMGSACDPTNVNNQWTSYPTGYVFRTTNEWGSYTTLRSTADAAWYFPVEADPRQASTVYVGAQGVERYVGTTKTTLGTLGAYLRTMDVYNDGSNLVIWTGSSTDLWKSGTAGTGYTSVYSGLPGNQVMDIAIDDDDYNHVYVSLGGYDYNVVYETTDGGSNWTDISSGLPPVPAGAIVINEQNTSDHEIYVGTDLGIFVKVGSDDWRLFNNGLPVVSITDLEIYYDATPANSKIYAATYGRDTWVSDMYTIDASPMTYVSSTVTQNTVSDVYPGTIKNEVICIEVVTAGSTSPLDITSFSLNTNGSTDANTDISNARLYYTGASNVFGTSNQFGADIANPNGNFIVNGTQTLECGTNYFWLTYDIDAGATLNDFVDAECTSLTVGTAKTPTVTAPFGSRKIVAGEYCDSYSSTLLDGYGISHVVFAGIDNQVDPTSGHYNDYTAQTANVNAGSSYPITVTLATGGNTFYATAWIDWNHDYDFNDAGEVFVLGSNVVDDGDVSGTVDVPVDALAGDTRMRIVSTFDNPPLNCGEYRYGETEDYTVNVTPAAPMAYVSSTTTQNNTANVAVGTTDAEIIGVEIVTSGATSPLNATSFTFSTNGSTDAAGDLTNAKLYYTGTSSTFATSNLFDTQASPNGGFTLTGSQTLSSGTNYFWLVYDVDAGATGGNVVDAQCTSLTVGSAKTPTVTTPAGNRPIVTDPCLFNTFPYTQNFDSWATSSPTTACTNDNTVNLEECWTNVVGDAIDWDIFTGSTGSAGTGPSGDHTGGGNYLYTEASGPCNSTGAITSPKFDLTSLIDAELTFWYHMYGADMNELSVQVSTNGGTSWSANVWSLSTDQGDAWIQATVDLTPYIASSNVVIRFTGNTGTGWSSDMAIDDINIDGTPAPTGVAWDGSTSTDWQTTTNWTPEQIPTATDNVTIPNGCPNYPVVDDGIGTKALCKDIEIENSASLTVAVDGYMTVSGSITNSAGNAGLVILSDDSGTGSLIHNTSGGVDATVNCRMSSSTRQWHMVSSPIIASPLTVFSSSNLYYYDESTADYWTGVDYLGSPSGWSVPSGNMGVGQGYVYNYFAETLTYTGQLNDNTSANSITINYTDNGDTPAPNANSWDDFDGWNFIGNPFTSAIDWDNAAVNHGAADIQDAIYCYDDKTAHTYTSYVGGVGTNGGTQYIPAMQGFFVKANVDNTHSSTLNIGAAALVHNDQAYWKQTKETPSNLLRLTVSANNFTDETVIRFTPDATENMDNGLDAYKLFSFDEDVPQIYTHSEGLTEYSINTLQELEEEVAITIPLKVYTNANEFSITASEFNFEDTKVFLKDNSNNNLISISSNSELNFTKTDDLENRFELIFEKITTTNINDLENSVFVYPNPNNGSFYIAVGNNSEEYSVEIHNSIGQLIYEKDYTENKIQELKLENQESGVYFIKIKFSNNSIINKKIIIE